MSNLDNIESHALTKPRDLAWENWAKFKNIGDSVKGYIRDVFYRPEEGDFKAQRGITLEQEDGTLINVAVKRYQFILSKTDFLRLGDPLMIRFEAELPPQKKAYNPTKQFGFYGRNLEENSSNPTVKELDDADRIAQGVQSEKPEEFDNGHEDFKQS